MHVGSERSKFGEALGQGNIINASGLSKDDGWVPDRLHVRKKQISTLQKPIGGSFVLTGVREPKLSTPLGHTRGGPDTRLARLVAIVHRLQLQLVHVTDPQIGRRPSSAHAARPGRGRTRIQLFTLLPQLSAEVSLVSVGLQVVETWLNETH